MSTKQFSTFYVANRLYGIDVMNVQEITNMMAATKVPLAPPFVHGLINLRGQIATSIGLHELFNLGSTHNIENHMNVICKGDGILLSLIIDQIGDVVEVDESNFESTPDTVSDSVGRFMSGVYKVPGNLLSVLDIKTIIEILNK